MSFRLLPWQTAANAVAEKNTTLRSYHSGVRSLAKLKSRVVFFLGAQREKLFPGFFWLHSLPQSVGSRPFLIHLTSASPLTSPWTLTSRSSLGEPMWRCWAHLGNPGSLPHLEILNCSEKSRLPWKLPYPPVLWRRTILGSIILSTRASNGRWGEDHFILF